MAMFLVSVLIFGVVIAGMAIGAIMGRGPIKGSCGGMGALGIDTACDICGGDTKKCEDARELKQEAVKGADLAFDATKKK